ncbi:hypothetical protein ES708_30665 [subsurface metagenome]
MTKRRPGWHTSHRLLRRWCTRCSVLLVEESTIWRNATRRSAWWALMHGRSSASSLLARVRPATLGYWWTSRSGALLWWKGALSTWMEAVGLRMSRRRTPAHRHLHLPWVHRGLIRSHIFRRRRLRRSVTYGLLSRWWLLGIVMLWRRTDLLAGHTENKAIRDLVATLTVASQIRL